MTSFFIGAAAFLAGFLLGLVVWLRARSKQEAAVTDLEKTVTKLTAEKQSEEEKRQWVESSKEQMKEAFGALAGDALKSNSQALTAETKKDITGVIKPLEDKLKDFDKLNREMEKARVGAYSDFNTQLKILSETHSKLYDSTTSLTNALRSPTIRGKWGELELRRIVEMAGMQRHVTFDEQRETQQDRKKPDLVVHLLGGGSLPVDAKVTMTAYLNAMEASDEKTRDTELKAHAKALKGRIKELGDKAYWSQFDESPEFVVMFVPNEASLGAAFAVSPDLYEFSISQKVLICSPYTLIGLLRAVVVGWQQIALTENARQIAELGKQLHHRSSILSEKLNHLGKGLNQSVERFNETISSFDSRLMPSLRKMKDLGDFDKELNLPEEIDLVARQPKQLSAGFGSELDYREDA